MEKLEERVWSLEMREVGKESEEVRGWRHRLGAAPRWTEVMEAAAAQGWKRESIGRREGEMEKMGKE